MKLALYITFAVVFSAPFCVDAATISKPANNLGLVGYWAFDEGTSTQATDFSGNGNIGAISGTGGPTWISGKRGKALQFAGQDTNNNQTVAVTGGSTNPELHITGDVTVSAWIRPSSSYFDTAEAIVRGGQGTDLVYSLFYDPVNRRPYFHWYNGSFPNVTGTSNTVPLDVWSHVAVTRSGTTATFYVNGVQTNSVTVDAPTPTATMAQLSIGRTNNVGVPQDYSGSIDDVRVYNRALSASEIATIARAGTITKRAVAASSLVAHWPLNEGTSTTVGDVSGNNQNGSFNGSPISWVQGRLGYSVLFNGSTTTPQGGYIAVPNSTLLSNSAASSFSVALWIKPSRNYTAGNNNNLIEKATDSANPGWGIYVDASNNLKARLTSTGVLVDAQLGNYPNNFATSTWAHVVLVVNRTTNEARWYKDGLPIGSATSIATVASMVNSNPLNIGAGAQGLGVDRFAGQIDDVRLYTKALTADEVNALYHLNETLINASQNERYSEGLVGYWTFNGQDASSTIADVSGNGWNGYLVGANNATSSRKTIGKVGQAFSFGGFNTGGINVGSSTAHAPSRFTVSAWVRPNTLTYQYNYILSNARDCCGTYNGIEFYLFNSTLYGGIYNSTNYRISTASSVATSTWAHVAFSYDGANMRLYVDGNLAHTQAQTVDPGSQTSFPTYVGSMGNGSGSTYTFNGSLDEVRLYSRALSTAEIKQLYLMGK